VIATDPATAVVAVVAAAVVVAVCKPSPSSRSVESLVARNGGPRRTHIPARVRAFPASRRRRAHRLDRAMPDLLDLLVLTLQAGLPPPAAFAAMAPYAPDVLAPALAAVVERHARGERFVHALDALVEHLGTRALSLVAAIVTADRSGLPLAPTIDRIADDARAHRRRAAEIEARRLPVRLAVPLVCCTLPSFVCIAIGPVLVGALSSLRSV
jgi:Flp pilus assembly protein TadB